MRATIKNIKPSGYGENFKEFTLILQGVTHSVLLWAKSYDADLKAGDEVVCTFYHNLYTTMIDTVRRA
jgi:hypothetical protein